MTAIKKITISVMLLVLALIVIDHASSDTSEVLSLIEQLDANYVGKGIALPESIEHLTYSKSIRYSKITNREYVIAYRTSCVSGAKYSSRTKKHRWDL